MVIFLCTLQFFSLIGVSISCFNLIFFCHIERTSFDGGLWWGFKWIAERRTCTSWGISILSAIIVVGSVIFSILGTWICWFFCICIFVSWFCRVAQFFHFLFLVLQVNHIELTIRNCCWGPKIEPGLHILIHPIIALAEIPYYFIAHRLIIDPALPKPALQCTATALPLSLSTNLMNLEIRL